MLNKGKIMKVANQAIAGSEKISKPLPFRLRRLNRVTAARTMLPSSLLGCDFLHSPPLGGLCRKHWWRLC
jgi:hypothetical protein